MSLIRHINGGGLSYDDRPTELDNVIINRYGVFIIEVKNYSGVLEGTEDDYEWHKYHTSNAGNTYIKTLKNPVKQVKRQIYILSKYLDYYGAPEVWIEGYLMFIQRNSPIENKHILNSLQDIDKAVHASRRNRLSRQDIDKIIEILS